ncbi:hypothetical protein J4409_00195 [Candidatus Woesearchaeota archaeon]|nr:hypothetical protein [Candidatus Woesearchaeota archaeon]
MKLTFDTETDSVDDLNNILNMLTIAIQKKAGNNANITSNANIQSQQQLNKQPEPEQQKIPNGGKTASGGRVIPFQDLSGMMSNIFSNQSVRRTK